MNPRDLRKAIKLYAETLTNEVVKSTRDFEDNAMREAYELGEQVHFSKEKVLDLIIVNGYQEAVQMLQEMTGESK